MKQITKVLGININHDDLMDISRAFYKMIAKTNIQNMADAMNILGPKRSFEVTEPMLQEKIQDCYGEVMDSLGPVNDDGSIDVLDYPSVSCGTLGFMLNLNFNKSKESWIWTLNLEVAAFCSDALNYVHSTEN